MIDPKELHSVLDYDPQTETLRWKSRANLPAWNARWAGRRVTGSIDTSGYIQVKINDKLHLMHRLLWVMHNGNWPTGQIDHINGIKIDNRLSNLRDVPQTLNQKNAKRRKDNTSGVTGVFWNMRVEKWVVQVSINNKSKTLGYFDRYEDAVLARKMAERAHGYHQNHGRVAA